jgi:2-iminobutanoate/2-iminopropanoate deaminase
MSRSIVSTPAAAQPGASYSHGVVAGGLLYTAGCGPQDAETGRIIGTDVAEQTHQTLNNLEAILATQGLDFSDLVKVTVHLQELKRDFLAFDAVYRSRVPSPYPARTTVGSDLWDILVEIDVVAAIRG